MRPDLYILFGIPTMFLVAGLIAYGMVVLDDYRHPRMPKGGGDTRA
jgi:hypothetical protein